MTRLATAGGQIWAHIGRAGKPMWDSDLPHRVDATDHRSYGKPGRHSGEPERQQRQHRRTVATVVTVCIRVSLCGLPAAFNASDAMELRADAHG